MTPRPKDGDSPFLLKQDWLKKMDDYKMIEMEDNLIVPPWVDQPPRSGEVGKWDSVRVQEWLTEVGLYQHPQVVKQFEADRWSGKRLLMFTSQTGTPNLPFTFGNDPGGAVAMQLVSKVGALHKKPPKLSLEVLHADHPARGGSGWHWICVEHTDAAKDGWAELSHNGAKFNRTDWNSMHFPGKIIGSIFLNKLKKKTKDKYDRRLVELMQITKCDFYKGSKEPIGRYAILRYRVRSTGLCVVSSSHVNN